MPSSHLHDRFQFQLQLLHTELAIHAHGVLDGLGTVAKPQTGQRLLLILLLHTIKRAIVTTTHAQQ